MQLTRAADYGVRVMIHLAGLPPGTRISHFEIAKAVECPVAFLAKVLQRLTRAGLIIAHRGNAGGVELPDAHRHASMLTVMEAIEGPLRLNLCLESEHSCSRQGWCPAHTVWTEGQIALANILRSATVGQLADRAAAARKTFVNVPDRKPWN